MSIILSTITVGHSAYNANNAVIYATKNFNVPYGVKTNPFIDVGSDEIGGNCTNFANQSMSAGMLNITTPVTLNQQFTKNTTAVRNIVNSKLFYKCNSVSNACQTASWRGAQNMFAYSRESETNKLKGYKLKLVTKTSVVNNKITDLDHTIIKTGDIVFFDFDYKVGANNNKVDHTAIVTEIKPKSWYDITKTMQQNNVRVTYQSTNRTDRGIIDVKNDKGLGVAYVYRPYS